MGSIGTTFHSFQCRKHVLTEFKLFFMTTAMYIQTGFVWLSKAANAYDSSYEIGFSHFNSVFFKNWKVIFYWEFIVRSSGLLKEAV